MASSRFGPAGADITSIAVIDPRSAGSVRGGHVCFRRPSFMLVTHVRRSAAVCPSLWKPAFLITI